MTVTNERDQSTTSSQGHVLSAGPYLDHHFAAARDEYEAMAHFANFQPGWTILDAGAGGGSFLPILSECVATTGSIVAVDLDPENVQMIHARAHSGAFACPVTAQVAALNSLPFDDNQFDAIWCANVFQYLSDDAVTTAVAEFKRVVRPGGLIVVKDSDLSANLVGIAPRIFWHMMEQACSHTDPNIAAYVQRLFRTPQLSHVYRNVGIEVLRYKTFLIEWRYPVRVSDRPHLETAIPTWGGLAASLELSENEQLFWRRLTDPNAPDYFLNSPDFYYREAFAVVVGKAPVMSE